MTSSPSRSRLTAGARRELIERAATEVFAERGYRGASMGEIARRSGVSAPVLYDHFPSKEALHRRLLERQRDELLALWRTQLGGGDPPGERVARAFDAYFAYVETRPYAWRMFFRDTSGEPHVEALHAEVRDSGRAGLVALTEEAGLGALGGAEDDDVALEMAVEIVRSGLIGLVLWWQEHPEVPRSEVVETATNVLWLGFERVLHQRRPSGQRPCSS